MTNVESYTLKKNLTQALIHFILIIASITMLVPFLWMVLTAFKTISESTQVDPFVIFPSSWKLDTRFEPSMDKEESDRLYKGWRKAVKHSMHWLDDEE